MLGSKIYPSLVLIIADFCKQYQHNTEYYEQIVEKAVQKSITIDYDSNNKPISDVGHISISHKDSVVAIALTRDEVGIDIEESNEDLEKLALRFFPESERNVANSVDFVRLWTKKESLGKLLGVGLTKEILCSDIHSLAKEKGIQFATCEYDGFVISIAAYQRVQITIKDIRNK